MKIIYEDENVRVLDKPAGMITDDIPLRVHRLDKETSGVFLVAKNEASLKLLQEQFKERKVEKKYTALVIGEVKSESGSIETLLGRSPKDRTKQKVFPTQGPHIIGTREAVTGYSVLKRFRGFTLMEAAPKTGRKHQIRIHFAHLGHPIAGDKLYGFKNQPCPEGLSRHFLHANYIKIELPRGESKEFTAPLPKDLQMVLSHLEKAYDKN